MNKLVYKVSTATLAALIWGTMLAPSVFADTTLEISGNGADSTNTIKVDTEQICEVKQTSNTNVGIDVDIKSNTGGNTASDNTGGSVSITTGSITTNVTTTVTGGSNEATNPCCCKDKCDASNSAVLVIKDNGSDSTNKIKVEKKQTQKVTQKASTNVSKLVVVKSKTGKNKANSNTGPGTTDILTGDVTTTVDTTVSGGVNTLNP